MIKQHFIVPLYVINLIFRLLTRFFNGFLRYEANAILESADFIHEVSTQTITAIRLLNQHAPNDTPLLLIIFRIVLTFSDETHIHFVEFRFKPPNFLVLIHYFLINFTSFTQSNHFIFNFHATLLLFLLNHVEFILDHQRL